MGVKPEVEVNLLRARLTELEEHTQGLEKLIEHIIDTCPEARKVILEYSESMLRGKK